MAEHEHPTLTDQQALNTLDIHYGMELGCTPSDFRRPGWTVVSFHEDGDPMALLFGQQRMLHLLAPIHAAGVPDGRRGGVVAVAPELRVPVAALLREVAPDDLFTPEGLSTLDRLVRAAVPHDVTPASTAHLQLRYVTPGSFRPYRGQWLDWIEPLDAARELDVPALSLLARYSRGVYAVRHGEAIASYAGIRALSPHVSEIQARTLAGALSGRQLGRAVASRATRAVLASGRLPLCLHPAHEVPAQRIADVLGYWLYADAVVYSATVT